MRLYGGTNGLSAGTIRPEVVGAWWIKDVGGRRTRKACAKVYSFVCEVIDKQARAPELWKRCLSIVKYQGGEVKKPGATQTQILTSISYILTSKGMRIPLLLSRPKSVTYSAAHKPRQTNLLLSKSDLY